MTVGRTTEPPKKKFKVHIKDVCYTRLYIVGHFDAPFEDYRLDSAVMDLVAGTGVPRSSLLPLTCFLYKGYLWTLNNRRLWALRHAFVFTGTGEEIDIVVLPLDAMPERKDYIQRLPFSKQQALMSPGFEPRFHGDQPRLQRLVFRPVMFNFQMSLRNGFRMTTDGFLETVSPQEAALSVQAAAALADLKPTRSDGSEDSTQDDDARSVNSEAPSLISVGSMDFPGRVYDISTGLPQLSMKSRDAGGLPVGANSKHMALPSVKEEPEEEPVAAPSEKQAALIEIAGKFKEAIAQLRVVLDGLDTALTKLAET